MSKVPVSISDIHQKAKAAAQLEKAADMAVKRFEEAMNKIAELQAENRHLKDILMRSSGSLIINPNEIKNEELVADFEIKRLKEAAESRPLSLEEAKIYQIMTNAKKVIREVEDKEADRAKDVTSSVPIQDLLKAAKGETVEES